MGKGSASDFVERGGGGVEGGWRGSLGKRMDYRGNVSEILWRRVGEGILTSFKTAASGKQHVTSVNNM